MKPILVLIILASISAPSSVSAPMDDAKPSEFLTVTPSESTGIMPPGPTDVPPAMPIENIPETVPESGLFEYRFTVVTSESFLSFSCQVPGPQRGLHATRWFCWRLRLLWGQRHCRGSLWRLVCLERF
ncbi:hypothetical protein PG997_013758 [Apiospora hydei]|uniref:Uncharacterized protein n=1 Tax=Apiospora hydei TaxID=1337664 RepID=A0ABR1V9P1_9PEZI